MKFGSLFAGIGGIDLGLECAGMECAWQVEIDEYCQRVLEKHWPKVKRHGDIRGVGKHNLETVDLIAGGFPCQPHSVAGKRKGAADDRNLWPEFSRVIAELKPQYILAENVPGIITTYLDTVLSDLESQGYACAILNLPAVAFDAPHRRERIFIVAHAVNGGSQKRRAESNGGMGKGDGRGKATSDHLSEIEKSNFVADDQSQREGGLPIRPRGSFETTANAIGGGEVVADSQEERFQRKWPKGKQISKTFGGTEISIGDGSDGGIWAVEPHVGRVAHGVPSRVDRLRGLGNAVVPQVAEWIGQRIMEHEKNYLGVE